MVKHLSTFCSPSDPSNNKRFLIINLLLPQSIEKIDRPNTPSPCQSNLHYWYNDHCSCLDLRSKPDKTLFIMTRDPQFQARHLPQARSLRTSNAHSYKQPQPCSGNPSVILEIFQIQTLSVDIQCPETKNRSLSVFSLEFISKLNLCPTLQSQCGVWEHTARREKVVEFHVPYHFPGSALVPCLAAAGFFRA
jgi:hypothetical protein